MPVLVNKMVENFGWVIHGHFDLSDQSSIEPGTETLREFAIGIVTDKNQIKVQPKTKIRALLMSLDLTAPRMSGIPGRIPTVKLKIPGKAFLKSESRTSITFKL